MSIEIYLEAAMVRKQGGRLVGDVGLIVIDDGHTLYVCLAISSE